MATLKSIAVPLGSRARRAMGIRPAGPEAIVSMAMKLPRLAASASREVSYRFSVGQRLQMSTFGPRMAGAGASCLVLARMPYEGKGALLYRVRSETEQYERIVSEFDLSENTSAPA